MSRYRFTPLAERDLEAIVDYVATKAGPEQAGAVLDDLVQAVKHLAASPGMGHRRSDLTAEDVRFWVVHSYLLVYRSQTDPIEVVRVLHGARAPRSIRDAIEE